MNIIQVLTNMLYLLALINPISKVSVLSGLPDGYEIGSFRRLIVKSSIVAAGILISSMIFGDFVLRRVFHVNLDALRVAGGLVLCSVGFNALRKGRFFEQKEEGGYADIALVPLACPMIAGPATIAACIGLRASDGFMVPAVAVFLALIINYWIMRISNPISSLLNRFNILGAIIRLTGLIVMTIGTQMVMDGCGSWLLRVGMFVME